MKKTSPSFGTGSTRWVRADFETVLEGHAANSRKTLAEFREASATRHDTSAQQYYFHSSVPNRSSVEKRLRIYNWNPGPRRGKEGAIEKQITVQEAIKYADHELLTIRFHVTHHGGCAVLFNEDTFLPDVKVTSIYLHDKRSDLPEKVFGGGSSWVMQGVKSRASFSTATAQRPKILHGNDTTHQQQLFQKARYREEAAPYCSRCDA